MGTRARHILLTGFPGCGKTTLVRRVLEQLRDLRLVGFYTQELRDDAGLRVGFQAIALNGGSTTLASVGSKSKIRVGKYGVELPDFEKLLGDEFRREAGDVDLFVIDEIGKMECFSGRFVDLVGRLMDGDVPVLATVAMKGGGFIAAVKQRNDGELVRVHDRNRDHLAGELTERIRGVTTR
ncbi:MAG: AAA family ATPase [Candidatus Anammoximicrobium sp.]|nr:AAA family ATPase [Candidatus Anammoximicrobium sp.]